MASKDTFEIDNNVREKMSILDVMNRNFFDAEFSLLMDFAPYREKVVYGKPMRTPEHRLIFVEKGYAVMNISFTTYELSVGSMLLVPRGSVIIMEEVSATYNPLTLAFNTTEVDSKSLMPYTPAHVRLANDDYRIVSNYFTLINDLIHRENVHRRGIDFLVVSLLFRVHTLLEEANQVVGKAKGSRAAEIRDQFLYLLNQPNAPVREVSWYAEQLKISTEYFRSIIKSQTAQTPMQWINLATVREAKMMLADEIACYTLDEIAEALHLGNASQFIKFFRKEMGETPSAFRKRMVK